MMNDDAPKFAVLCADCIYEAHHSDQVTNVMEDGKPWLPSKSGMFFIRNSKVEDWAMKLTQEMVDLVDKLCGMSDTFSLEVQDDLIKLATLMQDEQNKMGIRSGWDE